MRYIRKYERYPIQREARYFLDSTKESGEACTIVNICRKGMGIIFHTDVEIEVGANIWVDISIAGPSKALSVIGILKWLDKMDVDIIGGIGLRSICPDQVYFVWYGIRCRRTSAFSGAYRSRM